MADDQIALLCNLYPASPEKQERILALLQNGAKHYYRNPASHCTAWSYMLPYPPPKPTSSSQKQLIISGLELYTSKSALQQQLDDKSFFQHYHSTVQAENLYSHAEDLVAWTLTSGFLVREGKDHAAPFGTGVLVSQTRFVCRDRAAVLEVLKRFTEDFVTVKEPGVLTYAAFTRKKAPKEVLLVVRYEGKEWMLRHSRAREHDEVVRKILPNIENDMRTSTTMWQEVDESFVSMKEGGPGLEAKL